MFKISLPFGNPNLGSTPVTVSAVLLPLPVAPAVGVLKGLGVTLWTGQWWIEIPAGLGDAAMGLFTYIIAKKMKKPLAGVVGQFSRFIFTSGAIALFIGTVAASGLGIQDVNKSFQGLWNRVPWLAGPIAGYPAWISNIVIVWVAISFPAVLISVLANSLVSYFTILGLSRFLRSK